MSRRIVDHLGCGLWSAYYMRYRNGMCVNTYYILIPFLYQCKEVHVTVLYERNAI